MKRPWLDPRLAEELRRAGDRRVHAIVVLARGANIDFSADVEVLHHWPLLRTWVVRAPARAVRELWRRADVSALSAVDVDRLGL